jgi:UPF0755 protein
MKRRAVRWALAVFAAASAGAVWMSLNERYSGFRGEALVRVEHGMGTRGIAGALSEAGVIRYRWQFVAMRAIAPFAGLQAGEYLFSEPATVREVFARIARGDVHYFELTVPEGSNIFDIAHLLASRNFMSAETFLAAAADPALIRDLAPEAETLEGYLFPSTYRVSRMTTAADLCRMMTREFRRQWKKAGGDPAARVHDVVTLASLVEKETGVSGERAMVASVFANRLRKPMRLECDPTVIYAALLEKRYDGVIHRSDLDRHNRYNTYQNDGLPPGPITNPGLASLEAALRPAETDYLYFVAKAGGGGHVFSTTLAAHEKAVRSYRNGPQSRKSGKPTKPAASPKRARKAG